jgi:hypothetical protein
LRSASLEVGGKKLVASNLHPPTSPQKTEKLQTKTLKRQLKTKLIEHKQYIARHGQDMPEIRDWKWGNPK